MFNEKTEITNFNTLVELLRINGENIPQKKAFTFLGNGEEISRIYTYGELDRQARLISLKLLTVTKAGERALLLYQPGIDFIAAFFGCLYAGVIAVPAYPPHPNRPMPRLNSIIRDCKADVVLTSGDLYSNMQKRIDKEPLLGEMKWIVTDDLQGFNESDWTYPDITKESIAFLQYTSGSTSAPKGVMVTHGNLLHNERMIKEAYNHCEKDIFVGWLPLFHDMGLIGNVLQTIYLGTHCIMMPPAAFLQKPYRWLKAISDYRAHTSGGPNFAYDLCVKTITEEQMETLDLSCWRIAFSGAEPVRSSTLEKFANKFSRCGFSSKAYYPCYGLAEATLFVSGLIRNSFPNVQTLNAEMFEKNRIVNAAKEDTNAVYVVGCGRTWLDQKVAIVNPDTLCRCLPDEVGEIWVSGPSVAKGYWNKEEETQKTFNAYINGTNEGPFLRTGDLGFIKDNELFITGRLKDLIIIRGRNHYPQDIELTAENAHEALRQNCGAAISVDVDGEEKLVIVYEIERTYRKKNLDEVYGAIRKAVYENHELQVHSIALIMPGSIPKTSSGKIQRHACKAAFLNGSLDIVGKWVENSDTDETEEFKEFSDDLSQENATDLLLSIISSKLGIKLSEIDMDKPISYYGMDSLKAVSLTHAIESKLGISINMAEFFEDISISSFIERNIKKPAESLQKGGREVAGTNAKTSDLKTVGLNTTDSGITESNLTFPLSKGQRALWFLQELQPDNTAYNISKAVKITSIVDTENIKRALQKLVDRHAMLRTKFISVEGEPVQKIDKEAKLFFVEEDVSGWTEERLAKRICELSNKPFNLAEGPLFKAYLFRKSEEENVLLLTMHHIITDFWSLSLFMQEFGELYAEEAGMKKARLEPVKMSYADYVRWQDSFIKSDEGKRSLEFWKKTLSGQLPVLNLPTDRPRPPVLTYDGSTFNFKLDREITDKLKKLANETGITLYMILLAFYNILLYRYSNQEDIIVGSPTTGRYCADSANVMGYFINPVAIRTKISKDMKFTELLKTVKQKVKEAQAHQNYPFVTLVEELQPVRDVSVSPVFQTMFTFQKAYKLGENGLTAFALNEPDAKLKLAGLIMENYVIEQKTSQFDISLSMGENNDEIAAMFEYNCNLFNRSTIERMAEHFKNIAVDALKSPEKPVSSLIMLSDDEYNMIVNKWNDTCREYPRDLCVHQLFERQAALTPDSVAVVYEDALLSYGELNAMANRLAHFLIKQGVSRGDIVGVCLDRSMEMIVSLLAILKAGASYVPIDPAYPADRIKFMCGDANLKMLLTTGNLMESCPDNVCVVNLDEKQAEIEVESEENTEAYGMPDDTAYIIYTSGSTGKPKGVQIGHRSVVNFLNSMRRKPGLDERDTLLSVTTISFDIAVLEIFLPLISGARVVIAGREDVLDGERLIKLIEKHNVTVMQATPATWRLMIDSGWKGSKSMKILCGGEALQKELAEKLINLCGSLLNMYGPTETTVWSSVCEIKNVNEVISVGKPIDNTQMYILDGNRNVVPIGVTGELFIGGDGLSKGYLNRPELTKEKFVPSPFNKNKSELIYATGDLAKYLPDGNIVVLGRIDHQVKLRGHRIELGEIEAVLSRYQNIKQVVAAVKEISQGDSRLIAYYVSQNGETIETSECREFLKSKLPDYMIPSMFIRIDRIPLTPNGKVNRQALPIPYDHNTIKEHGKSQVNTIEKVLTDIWKEVLHTDHVGTNDNFFDLGGHSLLLASVRNKIQNALNIDVKIMDLFKYPTISTLSEFLKGASGKIAADAGLDAGVNFALEDAPQAVQFEIAASSKDKDNENLGNVVNAEDNKSMKDNERLKNARSRDIAVIGLSGRFPGAKNIDEFWNNLYNGVESITRFSEEEAISDGADKDQVRKPGYVKAWGVLEDIDKFDAAFFGYNPREAELLDPQQRVFLEEAWKALESTGYVPEKYNGLIGVYASTGMNSYIQNLYSQNNSSTLANDYQIMISNDKDFLATRTSYKMNLEGPGVTIQSACSSSLVAVHLACQGLINGDCDIALAGGVSIRIPQKKGYMYQEGMILSPDGHCRAFDEDAKGTVGGNGAGVVVLKRLEDAINDRDEILAVIKGTAINNDGALKVGYTAPRIDGQAKVIKEAQKRAGIDPETISYVETHGTGTPLGDPIEIEALTQAFGSRTNKKGYCAIGSVKTNIGHLDAAAGIAGFIKTVLSIKNKVLLPSINFEKPNPKIDFENSPFYVNTKARPWNFEGGPLRAGVSSFGIGGTNAHAILEEPQRDYIAVNGKYNTSNSGSNDSEYLLIFSAKTASALNQIIRNFTEFLKKNENVDLADVAYTLQVGRREFDYRKCIVCKSRDEAIDILENLHENNEKVFTNVRNNKAEINTETTYDESETLKLTMPELGKLWAEGAKINWSIFYKNKKRRRLMLPTYPFEGKSYWISPKTSSTAKTAETSDELMQKRHDISEWLYAPVWKETAKLPGIDMHVSKNGKGTVLVLTNKNSFSESLAEKLKKVTNDVILAYSGESFKRTGSNTYEFNIGVQEDYTKLMNDLRTQGKKAAKIVNLLGLSDYCPGMNKGFAQMEDSLIENSLIEDNFKQKANVPDGIKDEIKSWAGFKLELKGKDAFKEDKTRHKATGKELFYSMLHTAQAIGNTSIGESADIIAIVENSQKIYGESTFEPENTLHLGPCKVIPLEYPYLKCRSIDIVKPEPGSFEYDELLNLLTGEIMSSYDDVITAYRGNVRFIQEYEKVKLNDENEKHPTLKKGGVYLITGGLGGIGLSFAEYLLEKYQAKLVLVTRTPFPKPEEWDNWLLNHGRRDKTAKRIRRLKKMQSKESQILICNADVTDPEQMKEVRNKAESKFGSVNGIIHAAGNPGGGMIQIKRNEDAEKVLAPKVYGTQVVYDTFKDANLDFIALCSSLNALTGGFGQADYSAANIYLNAFAKANNKRGVSKVISISWDRWPGIGMATGAGSGALNGGERVHSLLGSLIEDSDERLVFFTELSPEKDWVLSEHLVMGIPTIAGTTYLEMARAAFEEVRGEGGAEITDVIFLNPMAVKIGETREVFSILSKSTDCYQFTVISKTKGEELEKLGWQEHVRCKIKALDIKNWKTSESEKGQKQVLEHMAGICGKTVISAEEGKADIYEGFISFGPRWRILKNFKLADAIEYSNKENNMTSAMEHLAKDINDAAGTKGYLNRESSNTADENENLSIGSSNAAKATEYVNTVNGNMYRIDGFAEVELPDAYLNDLHEYKLHPSLLDVTTGVVRLAAGGNYLPFSYKKITFIEKFPAKIYAGIRFKNGYNTKQEVITCDIDVYSPDGSKVVEIQDFSMKLVNEAAASGIKARSSTSNIDANLSEINRLYKNISDKKSGILNDGITENEGQKALEMILNGCNFPQIVVSTKEIKYAMEQRNYFANENIKDALEEVAVTKVKHPRPDLNNEYVPPKNEIEKKLARIWEDTLSIDKIGVHDDFFALGGDSLLLIQLHSKIKEQFDTELAVVDLYKLNTISAQAKSLDRNIQTEEKPTFDAVNDRVSRQLQIINMRKQQYLKRKGVDQNGRV